MTDPAAFAARFSGGAYTRPAHVKFISRLVADAIHKGGARILIECPPRHGKSELVAKWLPVWSLFRDPGYHAAVISYGKDLAERSVRAARDISREFSAELGLRLAVEQSDYLEVIAGRGRPNGCLRAAGISSGITGFGYDLIVMDDLFAGPEEANSATHRRKVYEIYDTTIRNRLDTQHGSIIGIMTRWHHDDLFGRLIRSGEFEEVRLPALAEDGGDLLGRAPGDALWPERISREWLEEIRARTLPRTWQSLYQGRPSIEEGAMFRRSWWQTVPAAPEAGRVVARLRYWDTAGSKNERKGDPDYAVGGIMSILDTRAIVVEEIDRDRGTTFDCERRIIAAAHRDGKSVPIHIGQEPGDAGLHYIASIARALPGWSVRSHRETGDKVARARPFASQLEAGNVSMVRAAWNAALLDELDTFPTGDHDDIVDCLSGAFACLTNGVRVSNPDGAAKPERPRPTQSDAEPDYDAADRRVAPHERLLVGTFGGPAVPVISSRKAQRWQW